MGGIELCQRLKREPKFAAIPVILASAKGGFAVGAPIWDEY
jgi:CheY-like chemotaxis protein